MKMKIAVASDLHLEFTGIDLRNTENADVLVLSGDICVADDLYRVAAPDPYGAPGSMKKFTHRMLNAQKYRAFFNMVMRNSHMSSTSQETTSSTRASG